MNAYRLAQAASPRPANVNPKRRPQLGYQAKLPAPSTNVTVPLLAHVQNTGDVVSDADGWVGRSGSGLAIEDFVVLKDSAVSAIRGMKYQAVLRDGSLSRKAGLSEYCGKRGENVPIHGLLVSLDAAVSPPLSLACDARFTDGSTVGDVPAGTICKASSGASLEAFRLKILH